MATTHDAGPVVERVRGLVAPIADDLGLDVYDVEQRGGTVRVVLDTPAGSDGGVDLDTLALATRLVSRELDHSDPVPGRYTLEVTSPGVERALRTPEHFAREIGKTLQVRLRDTSGDDRRLTGVLVAADDTTATLRVETDDGPADRAVALTDIDRARTVFEWGPQPKPGGKGAPKKNKKSQKNQRQGGKQESSGATGAGPTAGGSSPEASTGPARAQRPDASTDAPAHTDQEEETS